MTTTPTTTLTTTTTAAADAVVPARHPFAGHLRRAAAAEQAAPHRVWTPEDGPLPSLYISHGAPPVFEDAEWMTQLHAWARRLPKPKAVLVSAPTGSPRRSASRAPRRRLGGRRPVPGRRRRAGALRTRAPGMPYAHPTVEHFTPLFVTLGAATDPSAPVATTVDGYFLGLAKRSFEAA